MPSLKQHLGQVVRNHFIVAAILLAIAAILAAVSYQMVAPALGWSEDYREKPELVHLFFPLMALGFLAGAVAAVARGLFLKAPPGAPPGAAAAGALRAPAQGDGRDRRRAGPGGRGGHAGPAPEGVPDVG
jgi:hypothetical protein